MGSAFLEAAVSTSSHPSRPPPGGEAVVPGAMVPRAEGRVVARVLRWVRLATMAMLVVLAGTAWRDAWPTPGVDAGLAATVMVLWLAGTNTWSLVHDREGRADDGTIPEVIADLALALAVTVLGGHLVAETMPLLGILVVVEAAVRLPRRVAYTATGLCTVVSAAIIVLQWPPWAGWQSTDALTVLLPMVVALPTALVLVSHLAVDRAETRDVAIGQARRLTLVARELRETNARLASANEDLSAFAGRIAHDLRSPMGTVVTALETLQRPGLDLPDDTREFLVAQSLLAARRSIHIVEALLDHANAEGRAAEVALVDVGDVVAEVVATLPDEMLGGVTVELPQGPALAWADAQLLPLVLQNLVTNALTHGGTGLGHVAVTTAVTGDGVVVTVADDGAGIPPHVRSEVFTAGAGEGPTRGLGLGLATCHSIVHRHGGHIWVEDSELGGAAVRFLLPVPDGRSLDGDEDGPHVVSVVDLVEVHDDEHDAQRTLATTSSSGSSSRTSVASYRPGSAPTTSSTSRPHPSASRTSSGTV